MSEIDPYGELETQITKAQEQFASEAEGAGVSVLKDDGVYRHLRIHLPRASWKWCEVVTWPGALTLNGGLGCWTFTVPEEDPLGLFRPNPHSERVNPLYWEGKLAPGSKARVYSTSRATAYIRQDVAEAADDFPGLAGDVDSDLLDGSPCVDLSTEGGLRAALAAFEEMHGATYEGWRFPVESWDLKRFDPWFVLSCVVLPWAVEQYDATLVPAG
nr:hypothetical protein [Streptomyces sp. 14R-10]